MPLVTVSSWSKETRKSSAGKDYDVVVFYGTKHGYDGAPDEPWEKGLAPWADGEWIKEIQSYGEGAKLLIRNEKVGKYWKIVSIEPWGDTEKKNPGGSGSGDEGSSGPNPQMPNVSVVPTQLVSNDDKMVRCLEVAKDVVTGMMNNAETFKSLIKKSANSGLIVQMVKDMANEFYSLEGDDSPFEDVKSDSSKLESKSVSPDEVDVPF